jgi:hypothetical protein
MGGTARAECIGGPKIDGKLEMGRDSELDGVSNSSAECKCTIGFNPVEDGCGSKHRLCKMPLAIKCFAARGVVPAL